VRLADGGVDIYYIDESGDRDVFVMAAVAVPFLRNVEGTWTIVWEDQFKNIRDWRRRISRAHEIPVRKELHGNKLASGRGRYVRGKQQFTRGRAAQVYRSILGDLNYLPEFSIIGVVGDRESNLYGHTKLEAVLYALLQRMRTACAKSSRQGLVFFDQGHGEYRKLYRKARRFLPTGSAYGQWNESGASRNLPLDNFTKDANIKESEHSFFVQLADLLSYALFLKRKGEMDSLADWQVEHQLASLYDAVPIRVINTWASRRDGQGIVRLEKRRTD